MDYQEDVLVELSNTDIEELAHMYKSQKDQLPHLHSFLQNCVKSKKNGMSDYVTVFSPKNCWREDGTFIASMPTHGHDIVLHSLDPSGKNLIKGVEYTQRFKFLRDPARDYTFFYAVHEQFYRNILEVISDRLNLEISWKDTLNLWCLEKEKGLKHDCLDRSDVYVKQLEPKDISIINNLWPFSYPDSENKILDWIQLRKGYGVYLRSNNHLVSWVTSSCLGQMTALQTLEEYKNKGYGTLAVKSMSKHLAEDGFDCCATVYPGNIPSEAIFKKLGFVTKSTVQFIAVSNKY